MSIPACPRCGARRIARDYAPAQAFAFAMLGILFLVVGGLLDPAWLRPGVSVEGPRILMVGVVLFAYGLYQIRTHGNRYCLACGARFRMPRNGLYGPSTPEAEPSTGLKRPTHPTAGRRTPGKLDPATPIEPLLACLRFNDPQAREDAAATLARLTGESFGVDAEAWSVWWAEHGEAHRARVAAARTPADD